MLVKKRKHIDLKLKIGGFEYKILLVKKEKKDKSVKWLLESYLYKKDEIKNLLNLKSPFFLLKHM